MHLYACAFTYTGQRGQRHRHPMGKQHTQREADKNQPTQGSLVVMERPANKSCATPKMQSTTARRKHRRNHSRAQSVMFQATDKCRLNIARVKHVNHEKEYATQVNQQKSHTVHSAASYLESRNNKSNCRTETHQRCQAKPYSRHADARDKEYTAPHVKVVTITTLLRSSSSVVKQGDRLAR